MKGAKIKGVHFRKAEDGDILKINKLYVSDYGENYPYPLSKFDEVGSYIVAESTDGHIIGFGRATVYHGYTKVWEFGGLIVHNYFRQRGVAKRITEIRIKEAKDAGVTAIVSEPVCYRTDCASQYNLEKHGFIPLGIQPFKYPDIHEETLGNQAESVALMARYLVGDSGIGSRKIYMPEDILGIKYLVFKEQMERKTVKEIGGEPPEVEWHEAHQGSYSKGSRFVDIPANWREASYTMQNLLNHNWHFAAFLPGFGKTKDGKSFDYIRLFKPPNNDRDRSFEKVHVTEALQPLKAFLQSRQ